MYVFLKQFLFVRFCVRRVCHTAQLLQGVVVAVETRLDEPNEAGQSSPDNEGIM